MDNNNQDLGWVTIHRKITENPIWFMESFTKAQAWIDLILNANHKNSMINIRGNVVEIKRGQIGWSELTMSKRWLWSRTKVRRFLNWLKTIQQIEQQTSNVTTILTIINYDTYQQQKEQQKDNRKTTDDTQTTMYNNVNKKLFIDKSTNNSTLLKKRDVRDEKIEKVLKAFEQHMECKPTDNKPRFMAMHFRNDIDKLVKELDPYKKFTFDEILEKSFDWYNRQYQDTTTTKLQTVRKHVISVLFVNTRKKYVTNSTQHV